MSSDSESDFEINSIDRYTKRSEKLALEQPCEIPAGCGGVVFRWIDPNDGLPLRFSVAVDGEATLYLNGELVERGRARIAPGEHVLCVRVDNVLKGEGKRQVDWFKLQCEAHVVGSATQESAVQCNTTDDGQWLATTSEPPKEWLTLDYPASDWQPLALSETSDAVLESLDRRIRWRFEFLRDSISLGLPAAKTVWIRRTLTLGV